MQNKDAQVVSTRELADDAAGLVRRVRDSGQAVMVVEDGEPAAVLVTAAEFALLREQQRLVSAIDEGLADVEAGRIMSTDELKQSLEAEFGPIAWQCSGRGERARIWPRSSASSPVMTALPRRAG